MTAFIHYMTGEAAKVGDQVYCDGVLSVVEEIIKEDHILILESIVSGPGLMLTNLREGRVFIPANVIDRPELSDCILLVQRRMSGTNESETEETDD